MTALRDLTAKWERWSVDADREESGWQSDFSEWAPLVAAAQETMVGPLEKVGFPDVELVWDAAEESEEMIEFSRDRLQEVRPWLLALAVSRLPSVRWQVYEALHDGPREPWAEGLLRGGLSDSDAYARRRAALALSGYPLHDLAQIVSRLAHDPDPYTRRAAILLARKSADTAVLEQVRDVLRNDPEEFVRVALLEHS